MIKHSIFYIIMIIQIMFLGMADCKVCQRMQGPVLAGKLGGSGATEIAFQDLGTNSIWSYISSPSDNPYFPYYMSLHSWSPDGCHILLEFGHDPAVLYITDSSVMKLPGPVLGEVIWSQDKKSIIFALEEDAVTTVYSMNLRTKLVQHLFSYEGVVYLVKQISENELMTFCQGEYKIWDLHEQTFLPLKTDFFDNQFDFPDPLPGDLEWLLYEYAMSSDGSRLAGYYSVVRYGEIVHEGGQGDLGSDPEEVPRKPGFSIYSYENGKKMREIDLDSLYVLSLTWSPHDSFIALTAIEDPKETIQTHSTDEGVYIYDVRNDELIKIEESIPRGIPSFSPDEEWLTFRLENKWAIYNLSNGQITELTDRFSEALHLHWSPVIDYSETQCSASE